MKLLIGIDIQGVGSEGVMFFGLTKDLANVDEVIVGKDWRDDPEKVKAVAVALLLGIPVRGYAEVPDPANPDQLTRDLMADAALVISEVIGGNSAGHGGHVEWMSRAPAFHAGKAGGHAADAGLMSGGHMEPKNGEGALAHFNAVVVRGMMGRWLEKKREQGLKKR